MTTKLLVVGAIIVVILLLVGGGYYLLTIGRVPQASFPAGRTPTVTKPTTGPAAETPASPQIDDSTTTDTALSQDDTNLDQSLTKLDQDTKSADAGLNDVAVDLNSP